MTTESEVSWGDGWYAEEREGDRVFRWMAAHARCRITGAPSSGTVWLCLTGGLWGNDVPRPVLSALVNGRPVGDRTVSAFMGRCAFQVESANVLDIELTLDRTFSVPGDGRSLGVMVRDLVLIHGAALEQAIDADGWFDWERHEYFPFRWMGLEAHLIVPPPLRARGRFASLPIHSSATGRAQRLTIRSGDADLATLRLREGWHIYDVELPAGEGERDGPDTLDLIFRLDSLAPREAHPEDPRDLGARVGPLDVHDDRRRHEHTCRFHSASSTEASSDEGQAAGTTVPTRGEEIAESADVARGLPVEGSGWHPVEHDDDDHRPFHWMQAEGLLRIPAALRGRRRFCVLPVFSAYRNLTQTLSIEADGSPLITLELLKAWNLYSVALPPPTGRDLLLRLRVNKLTPAASHPSDPRPLGVRLSELTFHDDEVRHRRELAVQANAVINQRELAAGATTLVSAPLMLGVDLYGKCNITPACVYCLWDRMKALEGGEVRAVVDDRTLAGYGPFFEGAKTLVNCSFGEPLLHPRFEELLAFLASHGKTTELSTNGQAFTPRTVRALAGKPVYLYVSLDAATGATYARLRNERWDEIIAGLLHLCEARARSGGWPRLNMVFIPMRANLDDIEAYFRLCRLVEADALVLRPLLYLEEPEMERDRGGYHFDYARELLSRDELEPFFRACGRHAARYGVRVVSQFDFGKIEAPALSAASGRIA